MKRYLIVNTGSVSAKYSIYSELEELFFGHFEVLPAGEKGGEGACRATFYVGGRQAAGEKRDISRANFDDSLACFIDEAVAKKIISGKDDISSIGVRVVAPGVYFEDDHIVDSFFLSDIAEQKEEAPLHVKVTLAEIAELRKLFASTPVVGISDSHFHKHAPDFAKRYAMPRAVAEKFEIYRYGYHGISVGSIVRKLSAAGKLPARVIVCHLGGGSSVTAVKGGASFDTSMGYTPLEGLVTSTRSGDIDPVAVLVLGQKLGKDTTELERYCNEECGLLGVSGKSSDIRDILALAKAGNADGALALEKYVMGIKKYVGAYVAEMGGLDMLVFAGTIGERSPEMRERITAGLDQLGIAIDKAANERVLDADGGSIGAADTRVKVIVVPTDEMGEMAERVRAFRVMKSAPFEKIFKKPKK